MFNKKLDSVDDVLVSIIIVSFNNFDLLRNCLESLYNYTVEIPFEVIIVDNNSTERDINTILSGFPYITLIKNDSNRGFAAANNQGLQIARGNYVLFLNNDTVFIDNSVKKVYEFVKSFETDVLVGCKLLNEDNSIQSSTYKFPSLKNLFIYNFFIYKLLPSSRTLNKLYFLSGDKVFTDKVDVVIGAFIFVKRESMLRLKGFDERFFFYNEDADLCYRYKKEVGNIYYFAGTSIIHLGGASTKNNLWFKTEYRSVSQIQFFQKHSSGLIFPFCILVHYLGLVIRIPVFFITGLIINDKVLIKRALFNFKLLFNYPENTFRK